MSVRVESLHIYPIKSCRGLQLKEMKVNEFGPQWDRNWVVINEKGEFISQRQQPMMALVDVKMDEKQLQFGTRDMGFVSVPLMTEGEKLHFKIWGQDCFGFHVKQEASDWFSNYLNQKCYFLSSSGRFTRMSSSQRKSSAPLVYADGYPFLIISQASLDLLNNQLRENTLDVSMERFRPNIVISGVDAHQEDQLDCFAIGDVKFQSVKDCPRCVVVNVDQQNASLNSQVLKTLAKYRKTSEGISFGQNLVHLNHGIISRGDTLQGESFENL